MGSGEGFLPTSDEMKRLTDIDSRLKVLLPEEDFASIASVSPRPDQPQVNRTRALCVVYIKGMGWKKKRNRSLL